MTPDLVTRNAPLNLYKFSPDGPDGSLDGDPILETWEMPPFFGGIEIFRRGALYPKIVKNPVWILEEMKLNHEHSDPQPSLSLQILNKTEDESAWLMAALRGGNVDVQVPYRLLFAKLRVAAHSTPTPGCSTGCATGAGCPNRILLRLLRKKPANGRARNQRKSCTS